MRAKGKSLQKKKVRRTSMGGLLSLSFFCVFSALSSAEASDGRQAPRTARIQRESTDPETVAQDARLKSTAGSSEMREWVEEKIRERHPSESRSEWRQWGASLIPLVQEMYASENSTYRRQRLLEGLSAFYDQPQAVQWIQNQVQNAQNETDQVLGIRAVFRGQSENPDPKGMEETLAWSQSFLEQGPDQVRAEVVRALVKSELPSASKILDAHLKREKVSWIQNLSKKRIQKGSQSEASLEEGGSSASLREVKVLREPASIANHLSPSTATPQAAEGFWNGDWKGMILIASGGKSSSPESELRSGKILVQWREDGPKGAVLHVQAQTFCSVGQCLKFGDNGSRAVKPQAVIPPVENREALKFAWTLNRVQILGGSGAPPLSGARGALRWEAREPEAGGKEIEFRLNADSGAGAQGELTIRQQGRLILSAVVQGGSLSVLQQLSETPLQEKSNRSETVKR